MTFWQNKSIFIAYGVYFNRATVTNLFTNEKLKLKKKKFFCIFIGETNGIYYSWYDNVTNMRRTYNSSAVYLYL